ncbi:MAG: HAMP domain-containing protein [Gemmatimonadaceae bacterium]|nr:HAMP domain-containing protein [Gemmatimonadaceae bacterium]NUO93898.1 HAMP domain-containing protein [Gemmatimonadaceae bacterium]NUP54604.1 HAMP domain-containing protein [Gemmatimonadaceae bacterium]NUP70961.1 HAMP domain-containing protein [Gemmatimonadaceae bacterium]NUR35157.1 HAMP domain-containing protein [Gemmatimonadaceae bacterium]
MATLRARLTVAYAFALVGSMIIFAGALYFARNARGQQELGTAALEQGDRALAYLREAALQGTKLTVEREAGEGSGRHGTRVYATEELRSLMERLPGYFIVYDRDDRQIYSSVGIRQLPDEDRSAIDEAAVQLVPGGQGISVEVSDSLFSGRLILAARRDPALLPYITRIVAGVPTSLAELSPALLVGTLLVVFPAIVFVSVAASYVIAGRAVEPVERLINEVEAITDGRSLHRRLPSDLGNEELSRLGTTLNAMIARLESSFGALRRFTADASHELKTPLTVLRADVERAMHPNAAGSEAMQALEEALQETTRMADLVDSLLTLARADEGRFDLHREPIALGPVVRDVYETAVILGEHSGLDVSMSVLEEGVVDGDARRLRQLFLNLITNAIKYTPRGGRVELSLSQRMGGEIALTVRDSGIGISAADLPHVFDRFWRADRARSRGSERGGFGLGLSISQWIAQAHGGRITVQSRLGRGSVFTVTLPLLSEADISAGDQLRSELRDLREAREAARESGDDGALDASVASEGGREAKS